MTPTEAIEKALRKHMRLRTGDMMSGAEIQDATLIVLDALAGEDRAGFTRKPETVAGGACVHGEPARPERMPDDHLLLPSE